MKNWQEKTWAFSHIASLADTEKDEKFILDWMRDIGVIPKDAKWRRASTTISTGLDPESISGQYLAEAAYEFDRLGGGSPYQFVEWLAYEVSGTKQNKMLKSLLDSLGRNNG